MELRYESNPRLRTKTSASASKDSDLEAAIMSDDKNAANINSNYLEPLTIFNRFMNITANLTLARSGDSSEDQLKRTLLHDRLVQEGKSIIDRLLGLATEGQVKRTFASKGEMRDLV